MLKESTCIKVPKNRGQAAVLLTKSLKILDKKLRIKRDKDFIYIPLTSHLREKELETSKKLIPNCEFLTCSFSKKKKRPKTLNELLRGRLSPHLMTDMPRAIDIVGQIAIIKIPLNLNPHAGLIGKAILRLHKNVRTVLAKASATSGTYRLRKYKVIAGKPETETVHEEYGCRYQVDLARVYFSPRLSYEHNRIASLVGEDETIVDLFSGVGPFAILIAKTHENVRVYAIDVNPHALTLLKNNVMINKVSKRVFPILGEARTKVSERLAGVADRVIMNLPGNAIHFVDVACDALSSTGGMIHFYSFVNSSKTMDDMKARFAENVKKSGRNVERIVFSRIVRTTAPHEHQIVLDAEIL